MYQPITYSLLIEKNACTKQLALFKKHFGKVNAISLTSEIVDKFSNLFDIAWAAHNLLTKEDCEEYSKVSGNSWEEYYRMKDNARNEFNKVWNTAWAEYRKAITPATWTEFNKVTASAGAEYEKATTTAREKYTKLETLAFVKIYKRGMKST